MRSLHNCPQQPLASASNGGRGLVQRAPHPPGLADTENLYNAQSAGKETVWDGHKKPSFGGNLYNAVIYTYQGGRGETLTGMGQNGLKALTRATTQLDHEPSWNIRKEKILQYGQEMTHRNDNQNLNDEDNKLIQSGYYILYEGKYKPTVYGARMYYNDKPSLKPTAGGDNASAGANAVQIGDPKGTLSQELIKDYVLREVSNYGLAFNAGLDFDEEMTGNSIANNIGAYIEKLKNLQEKINQQLNPPKKRKASDIPESNIEKLNNSQKAIKKTKLK